MERNYQAKAIEDSFQEFFDVRDAKITAQQKRDAALVKGFKDMLPSLSSNPALWESFYKHPDFSVDLLPALQRTGNAMYVQRDPQNPSAWKLSTGAKPQQFKTTDALMAAAAQNPNDPILAPAAVRAQRLKALAPQYDPSLQQDLSAARQQGTNSAVMNDPRFNQRIFQDVEKEMTPEAVDNAYTEWITNKINATRGQIDENTAKTGYTADDLLTYLGSTRSNRSALQRGKKGSAITKLLSEMESDPAIRSEVESLLRSKKFNEKRQAYQGGV